MERVLIRKERQRELDNSISVTTWYDLKDFVKPQSGPVVSIYLPIKRTEREGRRDWWDQVEFKDLASEAERRLAENYEERDVKGIVERLQYMLDHEDLPLWIDASQGLGILVSNSGATVINLTFAPEAIVVVGDSYYVKPLVQNLANSYEYKLLLLNADFFALLVGDSNGVSYVPLPDSVKNYFAETYPEFDGETTALDYYSLEDHMQPYHGHKSRNDVKQEEAEKFFRYVDKAMNDIISEADGEPVFLVTLPEHDAEFRKIATFKSLAPKGILKDARTLSGTELKDLAVDLMAQRKAQEVADLKEHYGNRKAQNGASDELTEIGMRLAERMVDILILEEGKGIPGDFDINTGEVTYDGTVNPVDAYTLDPASGDIANAFVEAAALQDSTIIVLPKDQMPTANPVAAIFRN